MSDGTDELLAAFFAGLAAEQAAAQSKPPEPPKRLPVFGGGGSAVQTIEPEPEPLVLPQVASATLLLDLQADTLALADNDPVSTWADQSGNGHDFTQTGDARPLKQTISGIPFVVGDGVNDWMDGGNFADNLSDFAVIILQRKPNSGGASIISKLDVDVDWGYNGWNIGRSDDSSLFAGTGVDYRQQIMNPSVSDAINDIRIWSFEKHASNDADDFHIYRNGVNVDGDTLNSTGDPIATFTNAVNVKLFVEGGVNGVDDAGFCKTPLAAVLIYQITNLDNWAADRAAVEAWLAARYGISI